MRLGLGRRTILFASLGSLAAVVLLFLIVFDRYSYYDYHEVTCDAGSTQWVAGLFGSFGLDRPRERSAPYYLRVELVGADGDRTVISGLRLTSLASDVTVDLSTIKRIELERPNGSTPTVVYLANALRLDYEDYVLTGTVGTDSTHEHARTGFSCSLVRNYSSEWRIYWWDALMSV